MIQTRTLFRRTAATVPLCLAFASAVHAEVTVTAERARSDEGFTFKAVPFPAIDDAAATATFKVIGGSADGNAQKGLAVLNDGKLPSGDDDPSGNFFFSPDSEKGRLLIDLGKVIDIKTVDTYSWHNGGRAGQHYTLYAADGTAPGFKAEPDAATDPASAGWKLVGKVNTGDKGPGQHGVEISGGKDGTLGKNRYLLLETSPNEDSSGFGQTFWSEIDVIDAAAPEVKRNTPAEKVLDTFKTDDGKYTFIVDSTKSPDLRQWFADKAVPQVKIWYPKIVEMLAVPGFPSPTSFSLRLQEGTIIPGNRGIPAFASGGNIVVSSDFLRSEQKGEAVGCIIHEIVHIAQSSDWGRGKRRNVPSWVVEGVADYIRWFLFEPEVQGAEIRNPERAKYNASYRVTANFFDWVARNHNLKDLPQKLNATFSTGYNDGLWREWTGKTVQELEADWKASLGKK